MFVAESDTNIMPSVLRTFALNKVRDNIAIRLKNKGYAKGYAQTPKSGTLILFLTKSEKAILTAYSLICSVLDDYREEPKAGLSAYIDI